MGGEKSRCFRETALSKHFGVEESVLDVYSLLLPVCRDRVFRDTACRDATMIRFSLNLNVTSYFLGFCFFFFQDKTSNIVATDDLGLLIFEFPAAAPPPSPRTSSHHHAWFYLVLIMCARQELYQFNYAPSWELFNGCAFPLLGPQHSCFVPPPSPWKLTGALDTRWHIQVPK